MTKNANRRRKRGNFDSSVPMLAQIVRAPLFIEMNRLQLGIPMSKDVEETIGAWIAPSQTQLVIRLLRKLTRSSRYFEGIVRNSKRFNLNNLPSGFVTDSDKYHAKSFLSGRARQTEAKMERHNAIRIERAAGRMGN